MRGVYEQKDCDSCNVKFSAGILGGCKKKEQQPVPKTAAMPQGMGVLPQEQEAPQGHQMMSGGKLQVVVPANVKGKWSSVKLLIEDREAKKYRNIRLNSTASGKYPVQH